MTPANVQHTVADLLQGLDVQMLASPFGPAWPARQVGSVTADSREGRPDGLFVALPGLNSDGHDYIEAAVAAGCSTVICRQGRLTRAEAAALPATVIEVADPSRAYGTIAANYFRHPANQLRFAGVTGTNGKTTVTYLVEQVLLQAGLAVGVIGTVNNRYTGRDGRTRILATRFTTPEAFQLQQVLREMADHGVELVVMEVSSHALTQARLGALEFDVAAFTNLSRDHLDYHRDMDDYFEAKTVLFSDHLKPHGKAVVPEHPLPADLRDWLRRLHEICRDSGRQTISWGEGEGADVRLQNFTSNLAGSELAVVTASGPHDLFSPLVGRYNIDNLLTAYGICLALDLDEGLIGRALGSAAGAPGRVERVESGPHWPVAGPEVFVDYAHSPDALEKVLATLAALPHRELYCVFGCGGDRDKGKRPLMGEIAGRCCSVAVVTDDNPRTEDPEAIVAQILEGVATATMEVCDPDWLDRRQEGQRGAVVIRDRGRAIEAAIRSASAGDIVLIAGKGHEPYQLTKEGKRFFDDRLEAKAVLFSWTAELVERAVKGHRSGGDDGPRLLGPVVTDSRVGCPGGIFVALKGESHDGHDFAGQAVEQGAGCLVVERNIPLPLAAKVSQVVVADTQQALGDLAAFRRRALAGQSRPLVIGLTGSCGKTTVKEMVAAILGRLWPEGPDFPADCLLKTKGNFNNLIGLPLSLLPLGVHHRAAVLEMGMNRPGELRRLGAIADPDISCITNIHGAHLEGLESIEGVARAKEELFAATKPSATLIINLDDPRVAALAAVYSQHQLRFAVDRPAALRATGLKPDLWAEDIHSAEGGEVAFSLHHGGDVQDIRLQIAGEHNVANGLCAAAIAIAAGATLGQVAEGLGLFRPPDKRMQLLRAESGFTVINDTYNANPASMMAGLRALKKVAGRHAVAIIGDMLELGASSGRAHYDIGQAIAELAIDRVAVVGEFRQNVVHGALDRGYPQAQIHPFQDKQAAVRWLSSLVAEGRLGRTDAVLVKASRGRRFETIVAEIVKL